MNLKIVEYSFRGFQGRMPSVKGMILHPFLITLYPIFALWAANFHEISPSDSIRSFTVLLLGTIIIFLFIGLINRDWHKGGLLTTLNLSLFYSYGHVYKLLKNLSLGPWIIGRHRFLIPLLILLSLGGSWFILTRITNTNRLTRYLNSITAILVLMPLATMVVFVFRSQSDWDPSGNAVNARYTLDVDDPDVLQPDIYYIILDAYSRSDFMQTDFNYDNTYFIDFLQENQFYIAEQSYTNFNWTSLSLGSSLNMDYVQNLGIDLVFGNYPAIFVDPIRHSRVRTQLEQIGYKTIAFRTSYIPTEMIDADIYFAPASEDLDQLRKPLSLNSFESMLLRSTAGLILWDVAGSNVRNWVKERTSYPSDVLRQTILDQFSNLALVPSIPGPKFVFAHIVAPHPPFLFGPNGEFLSQEDVFTLADTDDLSNPNKAEFFKDQAIYITARVMETVEALLENSTTPPIIIIQADHGPCIGVMSCSEGPGLKQKFAILNAYHLPSGCSEYLYPTITPVNSFRIVFNCYFDAQYPLLDDQAFYTGHPSWSAYDFVAVTDLLK